MTNIKDDLVDGLVLPVLANIPDDFVLENRKSSDKALSNLINDYNDIASKNTGMDEIQDTDTIKDLRDGILNLEIPLRVRLIYHYLVKTGKIQEEEDYETKKNNLKITFMKWGGLASALLLFSIIGGVVTLGLMRNEINSNEFTQIFMNSVTKLGEMLITGKSSTID